MSTIIDYMTDKTEVMASMLTDLGLSPNDFGSNETYKHNGKFQGCTLMSIYFYWASLNGDGQHIKVTDTDRKLFAELGAMIDYVVIEESGDGFLFVEYMTTIGFEEYIAALNETEE